MSAALQRISETPLEEILREKIIRSGSMSVAEYMALCLGHPQHGYYMSRDPFGRGGDFTTAPEISQLFGEMLAAFIMAQWQAAGAPTPFNVIECGPGRGTLMKDALRVFRTLPDFTSGLQVHLIEISPLLRKAQQKNLKGENVHWHDTLASVPHAPFAMVANEFLDALPVEQFIFQGNAWHERRIGLENGVLAFVTGERADISLRGKEDDIFELSSARETFMRELAVRCRRDNGFSVLVDYGHAETATGDTLQAVRQHKYADVLQNPGKQDLTTHVDFAALKEIALEESCAVHGPLTQKVFLESCGIQERARILSEKNSGSDVAPALHRLTSEEQMGELFKVMIVASKTIPLALS